MAVFALGCAGDDSNPAASPVDGGSDATVAADAAPGPGADASGGGADAADAAPPPTITGMAIVTKDGRPLAALAGDALPLQVVYTMSDGSTQPVPPALVTWTSPGTVVAQDPNDAGANNLPDGGALPTAFFIQNPYRTDRTDYPGALFVTDPGTTPDAGVTVVASVADAGTLTATISVSPLPPGDPDAGAAIFILHLTCGDCHGATGAGSPPAGTYPDGGPYYDLLGNHEPYPAPGLNGGSSDSGAPNVAADPAWSAALLAMAAQADMDNNGVALRKPMPDWLDKSNQVDGGILTARDFADIFAYVKTQTQ
jgi:hypothetical protein